MMNRAKNVKVFDLKALLFLMILCFYGTNLWAQENELIHLWPDEAGKYVEPEINNSANDGVSRITKVSSPLLVRFNPDPGKGNGSAIIVCPGGGYKILAVDKEGYEIAGWLNDLGFTAFVLQYSVPNRRDDALRDIQQAIKIVRESAQLWSLDPDRLGVVGFSAGASLSARAATNYTPKTDEFPGTKPDFAMLLYPAYLDMGENRSLSPELSIDNTTPPMFVFATADDPYANSALVITTALRDNKVPVELHVLAKGGHGYGLRKGNAAAETWPALAEKWLLQFAKTK